MAITKATASSIAPAAKGDLVAGSATNDAAVLGVGANDTVLTADSSTATGLKWAAPAAGGKVLQVVQDDLTTSYNTSSGSLNDTGLTVTITPSSATSKIMVIACFSSYIVNSSSSVRNYGQFALLRGATKLQDAIVGANEYTAVAGKEFYTTTNFSILDSPATTSATTYKIQGASGGLGNVANIDASATIINSIVVMEIGA